MLASSRTAQNEDSVFGTPINLSAELCCFIRADQPTQHCLRKLTQANFALIWVQLIYNLIFIFKKNRSSVYNPAKEKSPWQGYEVNHDFYSGSLQVPRTSPSTHQLVSRWLKMVGCKLHPWTPRQIVKQLYCCLESLCPVSVHFRRHSSFTLDVFDKISARSH